MSHLSYLSPKTIVKDSAIHGRGLFASAPIQKDEIVVVKGGYIFTRQTRDEIEKPSAQPKFLLLRICILVRCPKTSVTAA